MEKRALGDDICASEGEKYAAEGETGATSCSDVDVEIRKASIHTPVSSSIPGRLRAFFLTIIELSAHRASSSSSCSSIPFDQISSDSPPLHSPDTSQ